MKRGRKVEKQKFDALAAARQLDPKDLEKILEEKKPATEEQQRDVIQALLAMAKELPGEELAKLVQSRQSELRALEILNLQRNVTGLSLEKPELDGLLSVFLKLPDDKRKELAMQVQQAAINAGLQQGRPLEQFAHKLARIGIHT